jgi:hypothetical protein
MFPPVAPPVLEASLSESASKRRRKNALPQAFLLCVVAGLQVCISGVVVFELCSDYIDGSDTSSQYHDLVAQGKPTSLFNYCTWAVERVLPIIGGALHLDAAEVTSRGFLVAEALTASGRATVLQARVSVSGQRVLLSDVLKGCRMRLWRATEQVASKLLDGTIRSLVTQRAYANNAGVEVSPVSVQSDDRDEHLDVDDVPLDEAPSDESDHEHSSGHTYDFDTIVNAMRLGNLMRNSAFVRDAVKASCRIVHGVT